MEVAPLLHDYLLLSNLKMSCMLLAPPAPPVPADLRSNRKTLCMLLPALVALPPTAALEGARLSSLKMPCMPPPSRLSRRYAPPLPLNPPSTFPPSPSRGAVLLSSRKMLCIPLLRLTATGEADLQLR